MLFSFTRRSKTTLASEYGSSSSSLCAPSLSSSWTGMTVNIRAASGVLSRNPSVTGTYCLSNEEVMTILRLRERSMLLNLSGKFVLHEDCVFKWKRQSVCQQCWMIHLFPMTSRRFRGRYEPKLAWITFPSLTAFLVVGQIAFLYC